MVFLAFQAPAKQTQQFRDIVCIKQCPSKLAFIFPPLFLIWYRLWWELGVYLAFVFFVVMPISTYGSQGGLISILLNLLVGAFLFLEGHVLREAALERRGFKPVALLNAQNWQEAEEILMHRMSAETVKKKEIKSKRQNPAPYENHGLGLFGLEA